MTREEIIEFRRARAEAGRHIDPTTAEVHWAYRPALDPYGVESDPGKVVFVVREFFARSPGSDIWVAFCDLPMATADALWELHEHKFPFSPGLFDPADSTAKAIGVEPMRFGKMIRAKRPPQRAIADQLRKARPTTAFQCVFCPKDKWRVSPGDEYQIQIGWAIHHSSLFAAVADEGFAVNGPNGSTYWRTYQNGDCSSTIFRDGEFFFIITRVPPGEDPYVMGACGEVLIQGRWDQLRLHLNDMRLTTTRRRDLAKRAC